MTYAEILANFNLKLDKETNAYFSNTEIATILNEALYRLIDDRYRAFEASNRISEQLAPLILTVEKQIMANAGLMTLQNGTSSGLIIPYNVTSSNFSLDEYTGWSYILAVKLRVLQADVTFSPSAVLTTSTQQTQKNVFTYHVKKIDIGSPHLSDPYLEGRFGGVGSENLPHGKFFYQLENNLLGIITRQTYGSNTAEDYKGMVWANDEDTVTMIVTMIRKPVKFTESLLATGNEYKDLTEAGARDLVDYAVQIANEITRDKEGYQFISSQLQKDIL